MLKPGDIPKIEPDLRVGIILPEDKFKEINIEIPKKSKYFLMNNNNEKLSLKPKDLVCFRINQEKCEVTVNEKSISNANIWEIIADDEIVMENKAGLKVKDVISGRCFHWKKNLDVFLSGKVEVKIWDNMLLLINTLPIEEYLMCVATSEMGRECPRELIESQTIVARSWMLANVEQKHVPMGFDVCNDDCCQRYQGTTHLSSQSIEGALATRGNVLIYNGKICDARYSKSCGGVMETFENVWENTPLDYMQPIPDAPKDFTNSNLPLDNDEKVANWINSVPETFCSPKVIAEEELKKYLGNVDEEGQYFRWQFEFTQNEMTKLLNDKLSVLADEIIDVLPVKRGYSGRLIEVKIIYNQKGEQKEITISSEYRIRAAFHESFLYSSAFIIERGDEDNFILKGAGWGHGAGYCQIGAVGMALKGYSTEKILYHYFPGSTLTQIFK